MAEFKPAYLKTKEYEGGYANVEGDRGGETYAGISRVYYPKWKGWPIVDAHKPLKWNQHIKDPELEVLVYEFYEQTQWAKIKGGEINHQLLAELLYDYYVHSGKRAIQKLQKIVGTVSDGIIGKQTLAAINSKDGQQVFDKLWQERYNFLYKLSEDASQRKFRKGWINRMNKFK